MSKQNPLTEEDINRERQVLEYRRGGLTFDEIAQRVGYADPSGAHRAFKRALLRTLQQPADEMREVELDRLDRLQAAVWGSASKGDVKAVDSVLKIMDRRARLLGLDAPTRHQVETTVHDGQSIDAEVERLRLILANHSSEPGALGDTTSTSGATTD